MKTSDKLNELVQFAIEHGDTLGNHKKFAELCLELRRQILALEEIANEADIFIVDYKNNRSLKNELVHLFRIERAIERYENPFSENQITMNLIYPGD